MEWVEGKNYGELLIMFVGVIFIIFVEVGNVFVKFIKDFCKKNDKLVLKGVYIEEVVFIGDN